jgi:hypothetical protein
MVDRVGLTGGGESMHWRRAFSRAAQPVVLKPAEAQHAAGGWSVFWSCRRWRWYTRLTQDGGHDGEAGVLVADVGVLDLEVRHRGQAHRLGRHGGRCLGAEEPIGGRKWCVEVSRPARGVWFVRRGCRRLSSSSGKLSPDCHGVSDRIDGHWDAMPKIWSHVMGRQLMQGGGAVGQRRFNGAIPHSPASSGPSHVIFDTLVKPVISNKVLTDIIVFLVDGCRCLFGDIYLGLLIDPVERKCTALLW